MGCAAKLCKRRPRIKQESGFCIVVAHWRQKGANACQLLACQMLRHAYKTKILYGSLSLAKRANPDSRSSIPRAHCGSSVREVSLRHNPLAAPHAALCQPQRRSGANTHRGGCPTVLVVAQTRRGLPPCARYGANAARGAGKVCSKIPRAFGTRPPTAPSRNPVSPNP